MEQNIEIETMNPGGTLLHVLISVRNAKCKIYDILPLSNWGRVGDSRISLHRKFIGEFDSISLDCIKDEEVNEVEEVEDAWISIHTLQHMDDIVPVEFRVRAIVPLNRYFWFFGRTYNLELTNNLGEVF